MTNQPVLTSIENGVMVITLNRPRVKNAIDLAASEGITEAIRTLERDNAIRVAIITGAGDIFCSGMDLKAFVRGEVPLAKKRGYGGFYEHLPGKPLIAAVKGYALAGGCELALCCDLIVAASDARFGIPGVKLGLLAAAGGLLRLPRQIPYRVAMELAITGEYLAASRAYELGVVNRLVEPGSALDAARQVADIIAANGPLEVVASKRNVQESQNRSTDEMFARQFAYLEPVLSSRDAVEGSSAFVVKRAPVWKGGVTMIAGQADVPIGLLATGPNRLARNHSVKAENYYDR